MLLARIWQGPAGLVLYSSLENLTRTIGPLFRPIAVLQQLLYKFMAFGLPAKSDLWYRIPEANLLHSTGKKTKNMTWEGAKSRRLSAYTDSANPVLPASVQAL